MDKRTFESLEAYMLSHMDECVHDPTHVYRVLFAALEIARYEDGVDLDILIAACLLHDIGRRRERKPFLHVSEHSKIASHKGISAEIPTARGANSKISRHKRIPPGILTTHHADAGASMAHAFLLDLGWGEDRAGHVRQCILSHSRRDGVAPSHGSLESAILYDADKLDVTGAIGMARELACAGQYNETIYLLKDGYAVWTDAPSKPPNFLAQSRKNKQLASRFTPGAPGKWRGSARRPRTGSAAISSASSCRCMPPGPKHSGHC